LPSAGGIIGVVTRLASSLEASAEARIAMGYARVATHLPGGDQQVQGTLLDVGLRGRTVWRIGRDLGLVLPELYAAMLVYRRNGSALRTWDIGAGAGIELEY
jgi:hypothetical protein